MVGKGLLDNFCSACCTVGIRFVAPCGLQFLDFPVQSFLDFHPNPFGRFIRGATRQALYTSALASNRHDLCSLGSQILDPDLNPMGRDWDKPWHSKLSGYDEAIFLGPMLGAIPTGNRLYKANLQNHDTCRFCDYHHEDIIHLSSKCIGVQNHLGRVFSPLDEQYHWESHRIFEVPSMAGFFYAEFQWPYSPDFYRDDIHVVWTDGSRNPNYTFAKSNLWELPLLISLGKSFTRQGGAMRGGVLSKQNWKHFTVLWFLLAEHWQSVWTANLCVTSLMKFAIWGRFRTTSPTKICGSRFFSSCAGFKNSAGSTSGGSRHIRLTITEEGAHRIKSWIRLRTLKRGVKLTWTALFPRIFYESIKWHLNLERKWLCELSLLMSSTKDQSIDGAGQTCDRGGRSPRVITRQGCGWAFSKVGTGEQNSCN